MRVLYIVALLLCAGAGVSAASLPTPPQLSTDTAARVAPVFEAFVALDKEFAALPAAKNDAERLLRLKRRDELGRTVARQINLNGLSPADGEAAMLAVQIEIERNDIINQRELKQMLPPRGWFLKSEIGPEATIAAWQVVQHATNSDMPLVRAALAGMKALLSAGEVDTFDFAMLSDRVAVVDGVRQTYGTQMICDQFKWVLYPVEDEAGVDQRRKEMGIGITLADQLARFANQACPVARYAGPIPK